MNQRTRPLWVWLCLWLATFVVFSIGFALGFWWIPSRAPFYEPWGDVYRGWPYPYGLDQGDVGGDSYAHWITYFHRAEFVRDGYAAVGAAALLSTLFIATAALSRRTMRRVPVSLQQVRRE